MVRAFCGTQEVEGQVMRENVAKFFESSFASVLRDAFLISGVRGCRMKRFWVARMLANFLRLKFLLFQRGVCGARQIARQYEGCFFEDGCGLQKRVRKC